MKNYLYYITSIVLGIIIGALLFKGCGKTAIDCDNCATRIERDTITISEVITLRDTLTQTSYIKGDPFYVEVPVEVPTPINDSTNLTVSNYRDSLLTIVDSLTIQNNKLIAHDRKIELDTPYIEKTVTVEKTVEKTVTKTVYQYDRGFYIAASVGIDPVPDNNLPGDDRVYRGVEPEIGYRTRKGWQFGLVKGSESVEHFKVRIAIPLTNNRNK